MVKSKLSIKRKRPRVSVVRDNTELSTRRTAQSDGYDRESSADERDDGYSASEASEDDLDASATQAVLRKFTETKDNMPAENGIIEEVFCRNFMCHAKLRVRLGPLINFIIGHNGSGKSAVLTALTLCLGGRATVTNRGQNLKSFIKEGQE